MTNVVNDEMNDDISNGGDAEGTGRNREEFTVRDTEFPSLSETNLQNGVDNTSEDLSNVRGNVFVNECDGNVTKPDNTDDDNKLSLIPMCDEDGMEVVIFDEELVIEGSRKWAMTLCGHFVGFKMSYSEIRERERECMNYVLENGPWMANNKPLLVDLDVIIDRTWIENDKEKNNGNDGNERTMDGYKKVAYGNKITNRGGNERGLRDGHGNKAAKLRVEYMIVIRGPTEKVVTQTLPQVSKENNMNMNKRNNITTQSPKSHVSPWRISKENVEEIRMSANKFSILEEIDENGNLEDQIRVGREIMEKFVKYQRQPNIEESKKWTDDMFKFEGNHVVDQFVKHFTSFLGLEADMQSMDMRSLNCNTVGDEDAENMIKNVSDVEIKEALYDICNNKAPGPDGYSAKFYKSAWTVVGKDVCEAVKEFFRNGKMLGEVNVALIILVPKRGRGLKQWDHISLYIFTLVMEVFALILQNQIGDDGKFKYHWGCKDLKISHICFADDLLVLFHGDINSVKVVKRDLDKFSSISTMNPNIGNTTVFFGNVKDHVRQEILSLLSFIVESLETEMFILPKSMIKDINKLLEGFLWCQEELSKVKAKVAWKYVCRPKDERGIGIKDLGQWNKVLIAKHLWNLVTMKESLWVK
ncbi:hypothetical protein Tco_0703305 [Tanacetum coccineum]|uniref:Reverse transcriptase domain-containing protein n=1 Tax=Tanacetum coccineum TaxID=301880 RepID=A0ABQ4XYF4_9ASTR